MWKKVLIAFIALIGVCTIGYAYYNEKMNAAILTYNTGGNVTGRVNKSPSNLIINNSGLKKGDKVLMGIANPEDGNSLGWLLFNEQTYTDYGCLPQNGVITVCNSTPITSWLAGTTRRIGKTTYGLNQSDFSITPAYNSRVRIGLYGNSTIKDAVASLNNSMLASASDARIIAYRNLSREHEQAMLSANNGANGVAIATMQGGVFSELGELGKASFTPCSFEGYAWTPNQITQEDRTFNESYWTNYLYHDSAVSSYQYTAGAILPNVALSVEYVKLFDGTNPQRAIRPYIFLDLNDTVFAVSQLHAPGIASVEVSDLQNVSDLYAEAAGKEMKLRLENPVLTNSTTFSKIKNKSGATISKTAVDSTVYLQAIALAGSGANGEVYTVSALVFDENNNFVFYKPLEPAKGDGSYEFDLTGIPAGTYKIGIVNEAFSPTNDSPADSSLITPVIDLEIVPPHEIQYTKTPKPGASNGDYEYTKNVHAGDIIGKITLNPIGIPPISYDIISDGNNSYRNFEIDGLSNGVSSATSLNVKIKPGAPDLNNGGLKAGKYHFCVISTDANGYPDIQIDGKTKVCTSFEVNKIKTKIAFDDKNQTKKSVTDAAASWNETATGNPTNGTKITYTIAGGDVGLIDIDKDSGKVTYKGNGAFGKVTIRATIDDDPATGNDNYESAYTEKEIAIVGDPDELALSTPDKIIYGDHFVIKSMQDDSMSTNVQYKFETDNQVFISAPQVNGTKAEFDALANSGSTIINVKVTRTADGELPMTKTIQIQVLPKSITITIDDKEKKRLEENPSLTYQDFTSQLVSWNGVKDTIDTSHIQLSTTAKKYSPIGSYPITSGTAEKQLNNNYPNYTFTIKQGLINVIDNGNKDFWDEDNDGCPDLNIKITDDEGNEITINGDLNDDGIPDYNIDIDGDGKPDLNLDTDKDGKPDLNLVILKDWKPSKCITLGDIQYSSGISAKAEINVDTNGDGIPDINIDNKGDFKPHINISKDGKTPQVNIAIIHTWKPDQDYKKGNFLYDTMAIDEKKEVLVNIDTDGDGYPDVNIDLDGDGKPDINKDVDGDWIPDIDIDSTGDGKPDINIDNDGDGKPDENIKEITEWKPEHNVREPFGYDTMSFDDDEEDNKSDAEVNGNYYPGDNVGGVLTGDHTNIMVDISLLCIALGTILLVIFKKQNKHKSS